MRHLLARPLALTLALSAFVPCSSLAAQAGDWSIGPVRRGGASSTDSVYLTTYLGDNSQSSLAVPVSRLRGLTSEAIGGATREVSFSIASGAGTITFTGSAGGGSGRGEYRFVANRAFGDTLHAHGFRGFAASFDLFRLALRDVTLRDVDATIAALRRYDDELPDAGDYIRFTNHDIDPAVITDLGDAGLRELDASQIIRLVNHDVDGAFVRSARAKGYTDLDAEGLIRLKNHKGEFRADRAARSHRRSSGNDM